MDENVRVVTHTKETYSRERTEFLETRQKNKDLMSWPATKRSYIGIVLICLEFSIVLATLYLTIH